MKIALLRHAEVEKDYHKRYNGHIDIGLSKQGLSDANKLAEYFKESRFDGVYCSDLRRARLTLKPFAQVKSAVYTKKLREKSWGRHEGMSFDEILAEGELEYREFLQWINDLDGEDYESYVERIRAFFLEELLEKELQSVLVVTHAGVIRVLISIVKSISLEEAFSMEIGYGKYLLFDTKEMSFSEVKCNFS